jgi:hypothetical protein
MSDKQENFFGIQLMRKLISLDAVAIDDSVKDSEINTLFRLNVRLESEKLKGTFSINNLGGCFDIHDIRKIANKLLGLCEGVNEIFNTRTKDIL